MFNPIKIMDINISPSKEIIVDLRGLENYRRLKAFIRWDNISIGYIDVPITNGFVSKEQIIESIISEHSKKVLSIILSKKYEFTFEKNNSSFREKDILLVTVVVCTRNRVENLELCLTSL